MEERPYFWKIRLIDIGQISALIVAALSFFLTYDHRLMKVENYMDFIMKAEEKNTARIDIIDGGGTQANKLIVIPMQNQLKTLSDQMNMLVPRVERIDANLAWVSDLMKEYQPKQKEP